jgi:sugar phosphate isomerase/epimerase
VKLALSGQLFSHTHELAAIADIFHSLGVNAIELWPENIPGGETKEARGRYDGKDIERVRDLLQAQQISVACLTLGGVTKQAAEAGAGYATEALIGAVDAATILGSPLVNCYLEAFSPDFFIEFVSPAVEHAASKNITIVLENEAHDDSGTAEGVRAIVEQVNSPHFGTVYDPCNYYQACEEPYPGAYEIVKDHIRYVHLKGCCRYDPQIRPNDHRGGLLRYSKDAYIGYTSIEEGVANADGILHRLVQDGYTGFITLEPHVTVADAMTYYARDVTYMRERLKELDVYARPPLLK